MHNQPKPRHIKSFSGLQIESTIAKAFKALINSDHEIEMITFQVLKASEEVNIVFYTKQETEND
ncbi:hypothetical protein H6G96_36550 [Nostoc sp. FACHB-892]|uniref:hypothetical protein n=1 Tax=Nostoc sp. FACHB-892 TaxID=2692843 RepID=UPI0016845D9C|nr:hypothetical protein [Nostoc sp. FACHB-892]MBD2731646.1 hypothetical protein [Nostoc sp. FACHB-892]